MTTKVSSIFRKIVHKETLNGLFLCTHERHNELFKHLPYNFYMWQGQEHIRNWNTKFSPIPYNIHVLPFGLLPQHTDLDFILSQTPDTNFPICKHVSNQLDIPLINFWHTFPSPSMPKIQLRRLYQTFSQYINMFITEENREAWGFKNHDQSFVIKHAIDIDYWKADSQTQRKPLLLSVANDFINRNHLLGFDLWTKIVEFQNPQQQLPVFVVGNTPGLSREANSQDEMLQYYQGAQIFLNTSLISPLPMVILEAMACECAVISTNTGMIPRIIQNGYNGILCEPNPQTMRQTCIELLQNPSRCSELGKRARETVSKMFPISEFVQSWNKIIKQVIG